jgi:hypothetical protein
VIEMQLRVLPPGLVEQIEALKGVNSVTARQDGMLSRVVVQMEPDASLRECIASMLPAGAIESILEREPTIEEAYLHILR